MSSFLLSVCLGIELLGLRVEIFLLFIRNWQTFPQNGNAILQPSRNIWVQLFCMLKKVCWFCSQPLSRCKMASYYKLKVILIASDMKNSFVC